MWRLCAEFNVNFRWIKFNVALDYFLCWHFQRPTLKSLIKPFFNLKIILIYFFNQNKFIFILKFYNSFCPQFTFKSSQLNIDKSSFCMHGSLQVINRNNNGPGQIKQTPCMGIMQFAPMKTPMQYFFNLGGCCEPTLHLRSALCKLSTLMLHFSRCEWCESATYRVSRGFWGEQCPGAWCARGPSA